MLGRRHLSGSRPILPEGWAVSPFLPLSNPAALAAPRWGVLASPCDVRFPRIGSSGHSPEQAAGEAAHAK